MHLDNSSIDSDADVSLVEPSVTSEWRLHDPMRTDDDVNTTSLADHPATDRADVEDTAEAEEATGIPWTVEAVAAVAEMPATSASFKLRRKRTIKLQRKTSRKKVKPRQKSAWEFLLEMIVNPRYNPRLIEWRDVTTGEFRINRPQELADQWTKFKGYTSKVKYESFARGLRYQYIRKFLGKRDNKKLVYHFCEKTNWLEYVRKHSTSDDVTGNTDANDSSSESATPSSTSTDVAAHVAMQRPNTANTPNFLSKKSSGREATNYKTNTGQATKPHMIRDASSSSQAQAHSSSLPSSSGQSLLETVPANIPQIVERENQLLGQEAAIKQRTPPTRAPTMPDCDVTDSSSGSETFSSSDSRTSGSSNDGSVSSSSCAELNAENSETTA